MAVSYYFLDAFIQVLGLLIDEIGERLSEALLK